MQSGIATEGGQLVLCHTGSCVNKKKAAKSTGHKCSRWPSYRGAPPLPEIDEEVRDLARKTFEAADGLKLWIRFSFSAWLPG